MKKITLVFSMLFMAYWGITQSNSDAEIKAPIQQLFDGMRLGDSSIIRSVFLPDATLITTFTDRNGQPQLKKEAIEDFIASVGTPHEEVYDEKIWSYDIQQDDRLATVWTPYTFYVGNKLSHCGVNAFQLFKSEKGWKIIQISDTRRRKDCKEDPTVVINSLMDAWHKAAATGDEKVFFGSMGEDAIYIGTDATERWPIKEFEEWSKKYFERDSAWDFTPIERAVYYSKNGEVAWFNETLDTWMGVCRGSGVLEQIGGEWKLQHYHLAIAVPNDKVDGYLELLKKE